MPSLVGKPIAVTQFNSGGFVAVSYEAFLHTLLTRTRTLIELLQSTITPTITITNHNPSSNLNHMKPVMPITLT